MRIITLVWVGLSNSLFAWFVLSRLLDERALYKLLGAQMSWKHYPLPAAIIMILLVGVVLEMANSPAAFFVNAGFFLLIAGYLAVGLAYGWQEPESRTLGLSLGIPVFIVLAIDVLLYAGKKRLRRAEPLA
ncbi:MAG: hypothetical protein ACLP3K_17535 [Candidatus Acidiferrales bacterium]